MSDDYNPSIAWRLFRNPIVRRELSVAGRSKKVVISFIVLVVIQAIVQTLILAFMRDANGAIADPTSTGKILLGTESSILLVATVVIFPALSCTSISNERENETLDLLLLTPMATWEIIWGKVVTSATVATLYLISALPFMFVAATFPGVSAGDVLTVIGLQMVVAIFITAFGTYTSVVFKRPITSLIITYATTIGLIFMLMATSFALVIRIGPIRIVSSIARGLTGASIVPKAMVTYLICAVCVFTVLYFIFFFLMTVARMKSRGENRAGALRVYSTVATLVGVILLIAGYFSLGDVGLSGARIVSSIAVYACISLTLFSTIKGVGQDAFGPRQTRRAFAASVQEKPARRFLWLWQPGAAAGYFLGLSMAAILLVSAGLFSSAMYSRAIEASTTNLSGDFLNTVRGSSAELVGDGSVTLDEAVITIEELAASDTEVRARLQSYALNYIARDQAAHWYAISLALLAIAACAMISWWLALATRRENTGGVVGVMSLLALIFLPLMIGAFLTMGERRSAMGNDKGASDGIGAISPLAGVLNKLENLDRFYAVDQFRELVVDLNLSNQMLEASSTWENTLRKRQNVLAAPLLLLLVLGLAAFLMLRARRQALLAMVGSNDRWPPPRLPPPREFMASGSTRASPADGLYPNAAPNYTGPPLAYETGSSPYPSQEPPPLP